MTRPAAEAAVMTVAHCTWQDAEQLLQKAGAMTPSASALQDLVRGVHEHWSTAEETVIPQVREAEGIPGAAVSAVISLDGVMGNRRLLISGVVVDLVYEVEAVPRAGKEAMMTGFRVMPRGGFSAMVAVCRAGMAVTYGSSIGTGPLRRHRDGWPSGGANSGSPAPVRCRRPGLLLRLGRPRKLTNVRCQRWRRRPDEQGRTGQDRFRRFRLDAAIGLRAAPKGFAGCHSSLAEARGSDTTAGFRSLARGWIS